MYSRSPNAYRIPHASAQHETAHDTCIMEQQHRHRYNTNDPDDGASQFNSLVFDSINTPGQRDEAWTTLNLSLCNRPGVHYLKLKVDTGAQGNILTIRTFRRMFPEMLDSNDEPYIGSLQAAERILTAYNGTHIKCFGNVDIA